MESIIKKIPCGDLKGVTYEGVERYLGIKYATAGRFELPKEVIKWEGVYEALNYGPAPIQDSTYDPKDPEDPKNHYPHEFMRGVKA
ncbi:MAG: carboxylesterase family protein, partial [Erysipelotrichaceae bacterium]|nr:carboxylesterase family protein [Erysipelotrichaceae bacterium]